MRLRHWLAAATVTGVVGFSGVTLFNRAVERARAEEKKIALNDRAIDAATHHLADQGVKEFMPVRSTERPSLSERCQKDMGTGAGRVHGIDILFFDKATLRGPEKNIVVGGCEVCVPEKGASKTLNCAPQSIDRLAPAGIII